MDTEGFSEVQQIAIVSHQEMRRSRQSAGQIYVVLGIAAALCTGPFSLVNLAFGFKFLVAGDVPSNLFSLARGLISCTLNVFLVHVTPLRS